MGVRELLARLSPRYTLTLPRSTNIFSLSHQAPKGFDRANPDHPSPRVSRCVELFAQSAAQETSSSAQRHGRPRLG